MTEIQHLALQLKDLWSGEPWFGRPVLQLLDNVTEQEAYAQPGGQHSIAQLVWHMANWRYFVCSRVQPLAGKDLHFFEANDWVEASAAGPHNWTEGLAQLHQAQQELLRLLGTLEDAILDETVAERTYTFRKLLHGILQHDIYHLGQIAYIRKLLQDQ